MRCWLFHRFYYTPDLCQWCGRVWRRRRPQTYHVIRNLHGGWRDQSAHHRMPSKICGRNSTPSYLSDRTQKLTR